MIRNVFLRDARIKVVFDPDQESYRMLLLRADHSAPVSFERKQALARDTAPVGTVEIC